MNRTRPKQIVIRVNEQEEAAIKKKVLQSGLSQQKFLISAAINSPIINTDGIIKAMPELKRIGNNLNQIARKCNEGISIDENTLNAVQDIGKELRTTWQWLRQLARGRASGEP